MSINGINIPYLTTTTVNNTVNNTNYYISGTGGVIGAGVSGIALTTGTLGFSGIGGLQLNLITGESAYGYSGLIQISGGALIAETSTSGILSGYSTVVFNHNKASTNLQPKLYVRKISTNNWMEPRYNYNDTFFEKDFSDYGIYNLKTGASINGWSGINLNSCSFFGFSGGQILCVPNSSNVDVPAGNNILSSPCLVKRIAGDFDIWAEITGAYTTNFHGNGIIALSANQTGNVIGLSYVSNANIFAAGPKNEYKVRDINGDGFNATTRGASNYIRLAKMGNVMHTYFKSGINDNWIPVITSTSGRSIYQDVVRDDAYVGAFIQTNNTSSAGIEYKWSFLKSWSPIELRASGNNNLLIINNVGSEYEFKVII